MDDNFLSGLRREPAPEFARRLRASLNEKEQEVQGHAVGLRATKWVTAAASIILVSVAFTFPTVRAGAQAFLDLFRVVNIAGVSFDAERLSELDFDGLDLPRLLGEQVEVLVAPGESVSFETLEDAGAAAGLRVLSPAWVPVGWERTGIEVSGESVVRVTASTQNVRFLLEQLAIDDVSIPVGLDGQTATLRVSPIVRITYRNGEREAHFLQSLSPEVSFPAGLDLPVLAEIGLRILGLDREEAYRIAQNVDWRSTLILPVPAAEAAFREVNVAGRNGLIIDPRRGSNHQLLWASNDQVFTMSGRLQPAELLEMAQTVQ